MTYQRSNRNPYTKTSGVTFIDGMRIEKPNEKAPEWVKLKISFKVDDFIKFAKAHQDRGWLNVDLRKSKQGKLYLALNDFKPQSNNRDEEEFERAMERDLNTEVKPEGEAINPDNLPY